MAIRVFIADDHAVVRQGLRALLDAQPGLEVVGEAGNAEDVLVGIADGRPDVVLLDLSMPGGGLTVIERLQTTVVRCLVLTMHDDPAFVRSAFAAGAAGYVVKSARSQDLVSAIRTVAAGARYVDPSSERRVVEAVVTPPPAPLALLTPREHEVLHLLAEGYTNAEVGERLGISVKTAETHRARLSRKLGARSRADLVRIARDAGITPERRGPRP